MILEHRNTTLQYISNIHKSHHTICNTTTNLPNQLKHLPNIKSTHCSGNQSFGREKIEPCCQRQRRFGSVFFHAVVTDQRMHRRLTSHSLISEYLGSDTLVSCPMQWSFIHKESLPHQSHKTHRKFRNSNPLT